MKANNFKRILIAALVLIFLSPFACGFASDNGSDDNGSDDDIFPVPIYINYGAPRKIACLDDGKLLTFDAPPNMRSVKSLRGLGFDSRDALALCLNKVLLIKPTGEKKALISGNIKLINVTKHGLIYYDSDSETLSIADYEGKLTEIAEAENPDNILTSVSPDGRKILCYFGDKEKFLITDGENRTEFEADIDKGEAVSSSCIFNNGSFIYAVSFEEKTAFYFANSDGSKEIISLSGEAYNPHAYFNKQGNEVLILINDALFKVNNRGEAVFISKAARSGEFGESYIHLIPSGIKRGTLCLNASYIYDSYQLDNFYYSAGNPKKYERDVFYCRNDKPYFVTRDYGHTLKICENKILYEDQSGNLRIDKYENGMLTPLLKIRNIQGEYDLNQNFERGWIYNDARTLNLYYFNEGETDLVREDILINNYGYSADGRCAAIRAWKGSEDSETFAFYKDGEILDIIGDDKVKVIICTVYDEVWEESYIGGDEVYYIDGFDRLMKWTPENGKEALLRKVGWYSMVPVIAEDIEEMNDCIG